MDERLLSAQTIVFDVGKVLLTFEPEAVAQLLPEKHRDALKEAMFGRVHRWSEFDLGRKPNAQIASEIAEAAGVPGGEGMVLEALYRFPETMEPLPLYREIGMLKKLGKRLYALTNYAEPSFSFTRVAFPLLQALDGEVVSSREKVCKPDEDIYRILVERYDIDPALSLYIDDAEANARAGERAGFRVWHYAGQDVLPLP
jgi:HAD superfamily hydrolase (TIGR01509 family)